MCRIFTGVRGTSDNLVFQEIIRKRDAITIITYTYRTAV